MRTNKPLQQRDTSAETREEPVRVDLGGGRNPVKGHINVDLRPLDEVDVVAPADDLPFQDGVVNRIHANSLIPHLEDLNKAFAEWSRVLAPGGTLTVKATHAHSTGIVADADHNSWSWTSETPYYFDRGSEFDYYNDSTLVLESVEVIGWTRPDRWWLRPPGFVFKHALRRMSGEIADELMKLPFAGGRVIAEFRKPELSPE